MNRTTMSHRTSGALAVGLAAALVLLTAGGAWAQARIDGITGTDFSFTTGAGELSTPDGGSVHFWGYMDTTGVANPFGVPQLPGPTLILNQGDTVNITLTSGLPASPLEAYNRCTSIVFPGHAVTTSGGDQDGLLTRETCPGGTAVVYTFTATEPGTYTYYSGTESELQVEMGLIGAIIVRPSMGEGYAYNDASTKFDHEYLFLTTQMDPIIHQYVEQGRFAEARAKLTGDYWPVYWAFNGRFAPDDLADPFVSWLPHQPYNCAPRSRPGDKLLMRIVGGDQGHHPFHYHGNNADIIARDGRMLAHSRSQFTTLTAPGETVDQIFTWTGKDLGWDIYGSPADAMPAHTCVDTINNETLAPGGDGYADPTSDHPWEWCADHYAPCADANGDGWADATPTLRCTAGYTHAFPVVLPEQQNLTFGAWWSGGPFMGTSVQLPPGEGGLNPNAGYFFMWHSHAEKELTNNDIFPGGMLSMMVVEPPGTPIP